MLRTDDLRLLDRRAVALLVAMSARVVLDVRTVSNSTGFAVRMTGMGVLEEGGKVATSLSCANQNPLLALMALAFDGTCSVGVHLEMRRRGEAKTRDGRNAMLVDLIVPVLRVLELQPIAALTSIAPGFTSITRATHPTRCVEIAREPQLVGLQTRTILLILDLKVRGRWVGHSGAELAVLVVVHVFHLATCRCAQNDVSGDMEGSVGERVGLLHSRGGRRGAVALLTLVDRSSGHAAGRRVAGSLYAISHDVGVAPA